MKRSFLHGLPVLIVLTISGAFGQAVAWAADPIVDALVKFKEDIPLPAKEPGVLVRLGVKEGDAVKKDQEIGQIDDSEAQMAKKAARYARDGAVQRAQDDVEIRFSKAQAAVAQKDFEKLEETNQRAIGAVPAVEVRRAKLDWDRAVLAIEKSGKDQELAKYEAWTKQAEFEAADLAILRRKIIAPFDGEIVEIEHKQDEWVNPGDEILRLARRDVMHIEGDVAQRDFDPHEVQGAQVSVEVQLARGRTETVTGQIVYVSPLLTSNNRFLVRAEVPNRQVGGNWILMDGQNAKMTIRVGNVAVPAVSRKP